MANRLTKGVLLVAILTAISSAAAEAPQKPSGKAPAPAQQQPKAQQQAALALPNNFKLNLLVRTSIIALDQANATGNYTVLQDLGAPGFRAGNSSARLSQIFEGLRQRKIDLTPVLFFTPQLLQQPKIDERGILRMRGFFTTKPERVNFDLAFQMVGGQWRLFGIGVNTTPAPAEVAAVPAPAVQMPDNDDAKSALSEAAPQKAAPQKAAEVRPVSQPAGQAPAKSAVASKVAKGNDVAQTSISSSQASVVTPEEDEPARPRAATRTRALSEPSRTSGSWGN